MSPAAEMSGADRLNFRAFRDQLARTAATRPSGARQTLWNTVGSAFCTTVFSLPFEEYVA